jgi:predicted nucleic acid-binding protein
MILLDTNVLSALMRVAPDETVAKWLDRQPVYSIWTTSITLMEISYGLQIMAAGRRCSELTRALRVLLEEKLQGRIASFDISAAEHAAELLALRRRKGRAVEIRDTMIGGIALATRATLATRNTDHFADLSVPVVNPWTS